MPLSINFTPRTRVFKDFYYGWVIVASLAVASALTIGGTFYAFGVFIEPLEEEFGWSRTQINASFSFSAVTVLFVPVIGRLVDRYGPRPVMGISLLVLGLSFVLRAFMTELWHWYGLSMLQMLAGAGIVTISVGKLVGLWFERTRGRVMGITMIGNNVGGLVMPPLAAVIVTVANWQWAFIVFGVLMIVCAPVIFAVVRDKPEDVEREMVARKARSLKDARNVPDDAQSIGWVSVGVTVREALRSRSFYAVAAGTVAMNFTFSTVLLNIIPHLKNEGMSLGGATFVVGVLSIFAIGGKLTGGYLCERMPTRYVVMLSLTVQIVGLAILVVAGSSPLIWVFVPIYGLAYGAVGVLHTLFVQETFGLRFFGSIYGIVIMPSAIAEFVGPLMMGIYFDVTGSYRLAYLTVCVIFVFGAIVVYWARPLVPDWRGQPVEHQ